MRRVCRRIGSRAGGIVVVAVSIGLAGAGGARGLCAETDPGTTDRTADRTAEWGRIESAAAATGRFRFLVEQPPADGRIPVPRGLPEIIRATLESAEPLDLPIEISRDGEQVVLELPSHRGRIAVPARVAVDVAEESRQFEDGRIVLSAASARVEGGRARLESQPGSHRIGFWTDPSDSVHWHWKATRWGRYDARLTFSNGSPAGSRIEVEIAGETIAADLPSTGGWYRYATLRIGAVSLRQAGDVAVRVRCTRLVGGAVMNLKAITLEPTCEGTPPVQAGDGVVTLHGRDATVLGTVLRYEPAEAKQTLGYWTRPGDAAVWTFTVTQPGSFDVEVLQGCGTGQGGSRMRVRVGPVAGPGGLWTGGASSLSFTVEDTGGFQAFRPRVIGRVPLAVGRHALRIEPERIAKAAACDIRQVRLLPVDADGPPAPD
jgi:hypothetical protein